MSAFGGKADIACATTTAQSLTQRHTFKQIADSVGISERMSDYITGHAHRTIGAKYGAPTVEHMAAALEKFPRYENC